MSGDWKSFDVDISSTNWVDVFGVRPCTVRALDLADDMMTMLAMVSMTMYVVDIYLFIYLSIYLCLSFINDNKYFFLFLLCCCTSIEELKYSSATSTSLDTRGISWSKSTFSQES